MFYKQKKIHKKSLLSNKCYAGYIYLEYICQTKIALQIFY